MLEVDDAIEQYQREYEHSKPRKTFYAVYEYIDEGSIKNEKNYN